MKTYKYTARSSFGATVEGVVEANTREEAIIQLKDDGYIVTTIEATGSEHDIDLRIGGKKTKDKTIAVMCNQFAIILEAGLPIVRTLELIAGQTEDKTLKEILTNVGDDVAAGYELAASFEKHGPNLPATFIESVRAGEQSGNLTLVFQRLAVFYRKQSETAGKVKSAMVYPTFIMIVAVIVVAIIMIFAVPTFKSTFDSMGGELPLPTKFMIGTSDFLTKWWWLIVLIVGAIYAGLQFAKRRNEKFHLKWSELGTKVPVLGRITTMSCSAQYASTMAVMMAAGLSSSQAVEVTAKTIDNYYMGSALAGIVPDLEAGRPLAETMAATEAYPQLVTEMTGVGEQTGELEHTLEVVSDYYDFEVQEATERAIGMIEPLTIVMLAGIVCIILLAVYLPMFSIYGDFNASM
ncbi:MAG: type II secretion system F family protein [Atopobiaceae bacterium]|nr:type II secretion system F family protein [Atopobiaceae bacterium]